MVKKKTIALLLIIMFTTANILNIFEFTMPTTLVKAAEQLTGCTAKTIVDDMGLGWHGIGLEPW